MAVKKPHGTPFSGIKAKIGGAYSKLTHAAGRALPFIRASKYGYSNARVSSMKSLLLKKEMLKDLTRVRSVDAVVEMLQRTYYKDALTKFSMRHSGAELVQVATSHHFARIAEKLSKIIPKSDREALDVMLAKWDVLNAKTILHARMTGKAYDEVAPFIVPISSFAEERAAKELFEGKGEVLFSKFSKTSLGRRMFASGLASTTEVEKIFLAFGRQDMLKLEILLDNFYYSLYGKSEISSRKTLAPIARIFSKEIDLKNASLIMRLKQHGISDPKIVGSYLIAGGRRSRFFDQMMVAQGQEETLKIAAKLFGLKSVPKDAVGLEIMLEKSLAAAKVNAFYRSTLSVGTILGFLFLKEEELNNIRKIAVGKQFGTPEEKIEEMLIFQE